MGGLLTTLPCVTYLALALKNNQFMILVKERAMYSQMTEQYVVVRSLELKHECPRHIEYDLDLCRSSFTFLLCYI